MAPHVSGSNYTFFVPTDEAFERHGFDILTDDILASEKGVNLLLNHFVRQRLYDKDLKHDETLDTIGGKPIKIQRKLGNVTVNNALIIEAEVFVYNLGTMFYINDILYPEIIEESLKAPIDDQTTEQSDRETATESNAKKSSSDVEVFTVNQTPSETNFEKNVAEAEDATQQDDEIITPRALPVKYQMGA